MITVEELALQLKKPVSWVKRLVRKPREFLSVDYRNFDEDSDFHRVCLLMAQIGEPLYRKPFMDGQNIVVRMSDDFAFIFNKEGKRV